MPYVVTLSDYTPAARYDSVPWTKAQVSYSPDGVQAYSVIDTITLSPVDSDPENPRTRNLTTTQAPTTSGWLVVTFLDNFSNQQPTEPVQYPPSTGQGAANPTLLSARYGVRHRIRDGMPYLDANPVPFNMVRLEELTDQIAAVATPVQTTFQLRYQDVPTQRYLNAHAVPGTLVAFLDDSWTPTTPSQDVDANGNFTLPVAPVRRLLVTYAWQYLSDGEVDSYVDQARQWLREFTSVASVPDGLVPALVSYASSIALRALARSATLANVSAGDSKVDWGGLGKDYLAEATAQYKQAIDERTAYYTQGPEALDPTAADISAPGISAYTPLR